MIETTQTSKGYTIATQGTEDRNPCIILTATRGSIFDKKEDEELEEEILDYFSNAISASEIAEKFNLNKEKTKEILGYAQREWDDALIDEEGATIEQDLALDLIIERASTALKEIKKESN